MFKIWIGLFIVFATYTAFVYSHCDKSVEIQVADQHVKAGWIVWQEKNCQSCHQIYGLGGYLGPDLTNTASETTKDDKYLHTFIKYGTGNMPNLSLNDSDVNNLIAFLKWIDKSGNSKVPKQNVTWTGNYNLGN